MCEPEKKEDTPKKKSWYFFRGAVISLWFHFIVSFPFVALSVKLFEIFDPTPLVFVPIIGCILTILIVFRKSSVPDRLKAIAGAILAPIFIVLLLCFVFYLICGGLLRF